MEARLAALSRVSWQTILPSRTRGAFGTREAAGSLWTWGTLLSHCSRGSVMARVSFGTRFSCGTGKTTIPWNTRGPSLPRRPSLASLAPLALLSRQPHGTRKAGGSLGTLAPGIAWEAWHSQPALLSCGAGASGFPRDSRLSLHPLRTILTTGPQWALVPPVPLGSHVSLEARESIFSLLPFAALQAPHTKSSLHPTGSWVANGTWGTHRAL